MDTPQMCFWTLVAVLSIAQPVAEASISRGECRTRFDRRFCASLPGTRTSSWPGVLTLERLQTQATSLARENSLATTVRVETPESYFWSSDVLKLCLP